MSIAIDFTGHPLIMSADGVSPGTSPAMHAWVGLSVHMTCNHRSISVRLLSTLSGMLTNILSLVVMVAVAVTGAGMVQARVPGNIGAGLVYVQLHVGVVFGTSCVHVRVCVWPCYLVRMRELVHSLAQPARLSRQAGTLHCPSVAVRLHPNGCK